MEIGNQHVVEAITSLNVWSDSAFVVKERLGNGPTNETWLIEHEHKSYVLRRVKPCADTLGLSLSEELTVVTAAANEMLAPAIVASCVNSGLVLSRYVDGRTWTAEDLNDKRQLTRLAKTLQRIHGLDCEARPLNLEETLKRYAKHSSNPDAVQWLEQALERLGEVLEREAVVCHNDLTAPNIVDTGQLIVIDWEYAALGNPMFDLAVVVTEHNLSTEAKQHFLTAYAGEDDRTTNADLESWCEIYKNTMRLWNSSIQS